MGKLEELNIESGKVSEKSEGVSEQDLGNISEGLAKAAVVRKQLKALKKQEQSIAALFSILIKEIDNDEIIKYIFELIKDNYLEIVKIFSVFYPFLTTKLDSNLESKLNISKKSFSDISSYIDYIKQIGIKVNENYLKLFKEIIFYYKIGVLQNTNFKTQEEKNYFEKQLIQTLKKEFL